MLPATGPAWTPAAAARLLSAADSPLRKEKKNEKEKSNSQRVTMQLRLISWFFITLNFMEYIGSQHASRVRRQGRMHPNVSQGCQGGCATCSDYNGCLSCKPRLFFVLERIGMKQIGVCLSSCPSGYYGTRYPDINKCAKCKADCDTCFTRNFCTKCKSGFYLYSGKCLEKCPDGLEANNHTMECTSIGKKNREEKRKKSNKDESKETRQESKGRAARRQNREQRENNNKTQPKKRKAPNKEQNLAPVDTAH
ncbi:R-spondin-3 isoform 2-T2 [Spheniscus humboldti]